MTSEVMKGIVLLFSLLLIACSKDKNPPTSLSIRDLLEQNNEFDEQEIINSSDTVGVNTAVDLGEIPALQIIDITADPTSGEAPLSVQFSTSVEGGSPPFSFTWDFGDGNLSTLQSPETTYRDAGSYIAQLTVIDIDGEKDIEQANIEVKEGSPNLVIISSYCSTVYFLFIFLSI